MLTPLQERVAGIITGLDEAADFALAGGAALIVQGTVDRPTRDLDFFGLSGDAVDRLLPRVEDALRDAGMEVERIQVNRGFGRLAVRSGDERTELDLAADARLMSPEPTLPALMMLESRYGLDRLFELAAEKDRGFSLTVFAAMVEKFARLRRDEFDLSDLQYDRLVSAIGRWRQRALELSLGKERDPCRGRGIEF